MRYFIIEIVDKNIELIESVIFGELWTQRKSIDKKLFVAFLCEGDTNEHPFMSHLKEYNEVEILKALDTENWTPKNPF